VRWTLVSFCCRWRAERSRSKQVWVGDYIVEAQLQLATIPYAYTVIRFYIKLKRNAVGSTVTPSE
jgi:hypothetical protein